MRPALIILGITLFMTLNCCAASGAAVAAAPARLTGVFYEVQGLNYKTSTASGVTNGKGEFFYRQGETVTFSVGRFFLGSTPGRALLTTAHLNMAVMGNKSGIRNPQVTSLSRFMQSLDEDSNVENGITITAATAALVGEYNGQINFNLKEAEFEKDGSVVKLFTALRKTLRTPEQARNYLRRILNGIKKETDVKIPMRDGSYLLADVFRPITDGKYPIVMSFGSYGKLFGGHGCICSTADMLAKEVMEDRYFEGNPDSQVSEHFETANTVDFVPRGYAVARVDERGICSTPGKFEQFSLQEAKDFFDAIEWLAVQPWSSGNVGTFGASYYGIDQYNMAQLQPPHLKAMIPIGGDANSYLDYIYTGEGLYNTFNRNTAIQCGTTTPNTVDWISIAKANPFDDPAIYGPTGSLTISPDLSKITVPFWIGMGLQESIHTRGSSEAFIHAGSKNKKLNIVSEPGVHFQMYTQDYLDRYFAFFDYWLKGKKNGVMEQPPVEVQILEGYGTYSWLKEDLWPIARTRYTKFYLNAEASSFKGPGNGNSRSSFLQMSTTPPAAEKSASYSAEVKFGADPCWSYGLSFVTEPMPEDITLAGYVNLVTWVSSSTKDMQIHGAVRVMDENNNEVNYMAGIVEAPNPMGYRPISRGSLKVSHRKLDLQKTTYYRPYHTNLKEDYAPLTPGEPVEAQVGLWPGTASIKKGWRLRVDIQPESGCFTETRILDVTDPSYQIGATNTIYTGPGHLSYLQIPVIPPK